MGSELIAYAMDAASFIVMGIGEIGRVRAIVLFGSVARGEAGEESDVDLFVDADGDLAEEVDRLKEGFYRSARFERHWRLQGVGNELHVVVGRLSEWRDLEAAISSCGIVLYGRYGCGGRSRSEALITWEPVRRPSARVMLSKALLGYRQCGRSYPGLVERLGGRKLGPRCVLVPAEHLDALASAFERLGVQVRVSMVSEAGDTGACREGAADRRRAPGEAGGRLTR